MEGSPQEDGGRSGSGAAVVVAVDGLAVLRSLGETETAAQLFARGRRVPALRLPFLLATGQQHRRSVAVCSWIDVIVQNTYSRTSLLAVLLAANLGDSQGSPPSPESSSTRQRQQHRQRPPPPGALIIQTRGHLDAATIAEVLHRESPELLQWSTATRGGDGGDQPVDHQQREEMVSAALERIHVVDCADIHQLIGAIEGLWAVLDMYPDVGIVVIEELDAFYWQCRSMHGTQGTQQLIAHLMRRIAAAQRDFGCGIICGRTSEAQRFLRDDPRSHIVTPAATAPSSSRGRQRDGYQQRRHQQQLLAHWLDGGLLVKSKETGRAQVVDPPPWLTRASQ
ncbi:hypothetical protein PTSG_03048 [Salpingoeca rosetta]|uniref:Uncharacterized protein n=1 Tax=Salpingoeca rosetta (strain ATCC 50818 / BSB-021) TaxID=946362 RepID=F2U439_SALR5|nr:uncharacterized protein PTSG_03048 [Salpingoeca rosetta]EGD82405.1 hypothetical protein PTSG_03048 [Salpingoeca rosetta]|eukprot:XP_004995641.1 hypothetical protein PTSG_03048 [Salpingoeca rosetta]